MAFPDEIVTFPTMLNITISDAPLVQQYQEARNAGNTALAAQILAQIPSSSVKLISASYLNSLTSTCYALQQYYLEKYSPAYVVSSTQPAAQATGDFWFQIL